jgi:hypothetical protein
MTSGTGWPFGGPWVSPHDAAAKAVFETFTVNSESRLAPAIRTKSSAGFKPELQTLMAFSSDGQVLELTDKVEPGGTLNWPAPSGAWTLQAVFEDRTRQQVKRAAPGGEGLVMNFFSRDSLQRYLARFDEAFAGYQAPMARCFYNDSYEVFGANWTSQLFPQFQRRHGYDLRRFLPALLGQGPTDRVSRVRSDYRQTIAGLLLEEFTKPWVAWAHRLGAITRNQAHGSPGNLLDLYAAADIPETEVFGTAWLELAGLEPLPGTPRRYGGREEILACKLASSAAHVAGKRLCSSESCTWLGEHFKVPLDHVKTELDMLFVMGVNHVFYHGIPFSPADAQWPGWLFYAETYLGPANPSWRELPALNDYVARCQSFLQAGRSDNDVLVYLPIFDLWARDHGARDMLQFMTAHDTESWLDTNLAGFAQAGRLLWDRGYGFDCVSDQMLEEKVRVANGHLQTDGGTWQVLVIAGCELMSAQTLERILDLLHDGATVLVVGALPKDVPGLGNLEQQRQRFHRALASLTQLPDQTADTTDSKVGKGRLIIGKELEVMLRLAGVNRERMVDYGLEFIRRADDPNRCYFIVNLGRQRLDGWIPLAIPAQGAVVFDAARKLSGVAACRQTPDGQTQVYLQFDPGESLILRTCSEPVDGPTWSYWFPAGEPHAIAGAWQVQFIEGGPALPSPTQTPVLTSWTEWSGDSEVRRAFSGTARYRITFSKPPGRAEAWALDLGQVRHSARVRLNQQDLGALYARPFRVLIHDALGEGMNELEIEVTNLMANRIADMDRRQAPWRKFFFVNIQYKNFDASAWDPLPSGLLGPVRLVPLRGVKDLR